MEEMQALAAEMKFEEAQKIKEKYDLIENYRSKSEVVNSIIHNVDVFSIEMEENSAYINYLHITNGCINQAFTFEYKKRQKNFYNWALLRCVNDIRALPAKSSYLLNWIWR